MFTAKFKRSIDPGHRAKVLVVDDSAVMRRFLTSVMEEDPCLEVVGTARNGKDALEKLAALNPDVVTMDIEMPEMDGLEALRHMRQLAPQTRVVMLSALTERGASATLEALTLGADDYMTKLSAGKSVDESSAKLRGELLPKVKQFFTFSSTGTTPAALPSVADLASNPAPRSPIIPGVDLPVRAPRVVAIGISTGGPTALAAILPRFPRDFDLPILIVQHMPPVFTKLLGERLQEQSQLPVREAIDGEPIRPGTIFLAPGDYHMRARYADGERIPRLFLDQSPPENSCRPAVDVLFESVAALYSGAVVAAVLTGMGHDGLRGCGLLKREGATILAQDEETSAVWGMPRAVVEAKLADAVLPLPEIVPQILRCCNLRPKPLGRSGDARS